ncbi:TetR family transcriptional regulator [Polynucleobacter sp. MWH-Tro8-2-5-gr]|uniref:Eco57I restriction-modification methylase domain-containing protein n=1 Tax=Polynucleobacter sp. MWH-Tro8-2-5-gr TaxID=1855606 RepID=UPI0008F8A60C|nr:DNA methyltransferase [Polynucleobacter sp. MWH-Tro8-2-5-gr]OIM98653.1 TetR family transcriptional regulator [Polynucleobacter sp. MWH-Tro8-2-5-gr]
MSSKNIHDEWLSLVEISGPFLAPPVLNEAFPQGLDLLDPAKRKRLRQTYEEWREALDSEDPEFEKLHQAWIKEVISNCLGFDEDSKGAHLKFGPAMPPTLVVQIPEQGVTLAPEYVLVDEQHGNRPLLLIQSYASGVDLQAAMSIDGWSATPADRMVQLCRLTGCRLGLVTDGERWMLIDAPVGAVTTFASWYARLWIQEPITLQAFVHLLGIRRFFVAAGEQIPALIDKSLQHQDEVTTALGEQVQRAVEVLIQSLDRADQDRNRELLKDVTPAELYEAGLTVMMRLVFLLSAEERGLLLMGDECYEENYAISTLRMQLRSESEEILERRWDAWSRLLSVFRAVYGGIDHENMRLPALGGSLFDPDRFPFLEGRAKGSNWHKEPAKPLPIDNSTVLLLLEAIQQYQGRNLSYRALDVEQIGYVYEGLLERTVKRINEVALELDATKNSKNPWVKLSELDAARLRGLEQLIELLQARSGGSLGRVRGDVGRVVDDAMADRLLTACQGEIKLRDQLLPYVHLIRTDPWGYPLVYPAGAFMVTGGLDRRATGAHYTPKSLTEKIVIETLTPLAYVGPAEGVLRSEWVLKSPDELLDLKICDPTMGSGAFLVQACRWVANRLVESWDRVEALGKNICVDGKISEPGSGRELLPEDFEARLVIARRLIAERCLYGVDLNPLAVELAKLSIWLVTMAKGRPFGFLDHNLRCGDSLLGIDQLAQLTELLIKPSGKGQQRLFGKDIEQSVNEAIELRQQLREIPIYDIRDVQAIAQLDSDVRRRLVIAELLADALIGIIFSSDTIRMREARLSALAIQADSLVRGDDEIFETIKYQAAHDLALDLPPGKLLRKPVHWPLEFPEVFCRENGGFDAWISNPPFMGGRKISSNMGDSYEKAIKKLHLDDAKGSVNFVAYFLLRSLRMVRTTGIAGFITTDSITESDTRTQVLTRVFQQATTFFAHSSFPWPGKAGVYVSILVFSRGGWKGKVLLDGEEVESISTMLEAGSELPSPYLLASNASLCSDGVKVQGIGFVLDEGEASSILHNEPASTNVITKYIVGDDINNCPNQTGSRWIINFGSRDRGDAESFKAAWEIVVERVRPYRDSLTRQVHESCFWKFWDRREGFHNRIRQHGRVLVASKLSKYFCLTFGNPQYIYSEKVKLFDFMTYSAFAVLQSVAHTEWALVWGSTTGETPAYVGTSCFDTFPFPSDFVVDGKLSYEFINPKLEGIGKAYFECRDSLCALRNLGFTAVYNLVHSQNEISKEVALFRELISQLDRAVIDAYGWSDIDLNHHFIETKRGIRYGVSQASQMEIIKRLTHLNHERFKNATYSIDGELSVMKPKRGRKEISMPQSTTGSLFDD